MAFKFVIISCLVAAAAAAALPAAVVEPVVAAPAVVARLEEPDTSSYTFGYDVFDSVTGDVKGQSEKREGPVVIGRYYLNQDDNTRRVVEYYADNFSGFTARVTYEPLTAPIVPAETVVEPVAARVVAAPAPVAPAPVAPAPVAFAPAFAPYTAALTAGAPFTRFAPYSRLAPLRAPVVAV